MKVIVILILLSILMVANSQDFLSSESLESSEEYNCEFYCTQLELKFSICCKRLGTSQDFCKHRALRRSRNKECQCKLAF